MKPQVFEFGSEPWPEGKGVLQIYVPVLREHNPELAVLIDQWRQAIEGAPVTHIPNGLLHITLVISSCQANQPVNQLVGCQTR